MTSSLAPSLCPYRPCISTVFPSREECTLDSNTVLFLTLRRDWYHLERYVPISHEHRRNESLSSGEPIRGLGQRVEYSSLLSLRKDLPHPSTTIPGPYVLHHTWRQKYILSRRAYRYAHPYLQPSSSPNPNHKPPRYF